MLQNIGFFISVKHLLYLCVYYLNSNNIVMKKIVPVIFLFIFFAFTSCEGLFDTDDDGLTTKEVIEGLKVALEIGTDTATSVLGKTNGYYGNSLLKIPLPPEADIIVDNLVLLPGGEELVDNVIEGINRAAESAANEAAPIFKNAITGMTISDAWDILNGSNPAIAFKSAGSFDSTAATGYFQVKTYDALTDLYSPKINGALDQDLLGIYSPNDAWEDLTGAYNEVANSATGQFLGLTPVNTDIGEYCTEKALDGLFCKVGEEEKKIRRNPFQWAIDIIEKVFGSVFKE
jgi:hypothetical protein